MDSKTKLALGFGITANLASLGFFKYFGFFIDSLDQILSQVGWQRDLPVLEVILPVGVSFFVFQGISYLVDLRRGEIEKNNSFVEVFLYISFFPQLVAGPIVRAKDFFPQLQAEAPKSLPVSRAWVLICTGLVKKVVIAHYISVLLVDPVFANYQDYYWWQVTLAVYGYAVQIYCDFSAYSDMAIGTAALLGFNFLDNFNKPYRSRTLQEFWRRWHISLSSWLRDYLYIPLGGSRNGKVKTYRNLFLTMLLGGLWHGASWNFVIWGMLHGSYLGMEKWTMNRLGNFKKNFFTAFMGWCLVFHFVCFCWIFFRAEDLATSVGMIQHIASLQIPAISYEYANQLRYELLGILMVLGLGIHFLPEQTSLKLSNLIQPLPAVVQGALAGLAISIIQILGPSGIAPFIYFQF